MSATAERPAGHEHASNVSLAALLQPHWITLALAFVAVLAETGADIVDPWPIKIIVDNLLQHKPLSGWLNRLASGVFGHHEIALLNFALAIVAVAAVVGAVGAYAEKHLTTSVGQWVTHDLRRTLYDHIQRLSLADHDRARTGDLISRATSDIEAIQDFITSALFGMVVNALTLVGMIAVMLYVNWRFTLMALSITPVLFAVVYSYTRRIKRASRAVRQKESELVSVMEQALSSARLVKAFAREDYELQRFVSQSLDNVETALKARNIKATLSPLVEVIVAGGTCLVLAYGSHLALAGKLNAGVLIVFLLYLNRMYKPMRELSKMMDTLSKALVGHERIQEVLDIESRGRIRDLPHARRAPRFKGCIEFTGVSFGYDDASAVLKDVSFRIEPGQVVAFVGASGSGKTTIASLIARFYDPQAGRITVDGTDIRRFKLKSLREQISFVLQDTLLFRAPVWENITYGKPEATFDEITRAARLADAHEFIENLPHGYDTLVGERGVSLSGGQRQRIAIARAIIRNAPILILDEPTTGLDALSEQAVVGALQPLMKVRTCIVITHHLDTIRRADVIFVMRDGEIVERGTHDELVARGGLYADMHKVNTSDDAARASA